MPHATPHPHLAATAPPPSIDRAELRRLRQRNRELTHRLSAQLQLAGLLLAEHRRGLRASGGHDADAPARAALVRAEVQLRTLDTVNRALLTAADGHCDAAAVLTRVAEGMQRASPHAFRLVLDVAPERLPASEMTSLALLVNELLANSVRHGLPHVAAPATPTVTLSLKRAGRALHLRYADNGPGADATAEYGHGSDIVADFLADLEASWERTRAPGYGVAARWVPRGG